MKIGIAAGLIGIAAGLIGAYLFVVIGIREWFK